MYYLDCSKLDKIIWDNFRVIFIIGMAIQVVTLILAFIYGVKIIVLIMSLLVISEVAAGITRGITKKG